MSLLKTVSIAKINSAMMMDATITTMALLCNSFQVGQETLVSNSLVVSSKYVLILLISFLLARAPGLEPRSTVLETAILPLNYARQC
jgi:hypothetical protein